MKKIIAYLLTLKAFKVCLAVISNAIRAISEPFWKKIEDHFYNPYDFDENNVSYSKGIADKVIQACKSNGFDLSGKRLLELGPGGFLGTGAYFKKEGLREYCVIDSMNHFERIDAKTEGYYRSIDPNFVKDGYFDPSYVKVLSYENGVIPVDDASIDIVTSNAVYEHVDHPAESIQELARITRSGGLSIHQIDYRDHIFDQKSLYFLTISKWTFDFFFKRTGGWVNRFRHSDFRKAFIQNGFEILSDIPDYGYDEKSVEYYRNRLSKISTEDLPISSGFFVVRKK